VAAASNGATATASSTYNGTTTPASAVINGDHKGVNWGSGGGWQDNNPSTYPDWVQVDFNGNKTISEIDVYTIQDNYSSPSEPTETMTFSNYGITNFAVQYWDGSAWQTVSGGSVSGNNKVWRKFTFSSVTTDKIRVYITGTADGISRLAEIEAYASYTYDANGSVTGDGTHTYQYDARNRLVSVDAGVTASYVYDHNNRRVKKTIGTSVTHCVWEGSQVIAEYDGTSSSLLSESVYSGGRLIAKFAGAVTRYYLNDWLSQRLTLDTSGAIVGKQAHLPFGEEFGTSGEQDKHRLTKYERDAETGWDQAINRSHSPTLGRFMQADPYKASGYVIDPQSWNRYSYVQNNPVNFVDPTGLNKAPAFSYTMQVKAKYDPLDPLDAADSGNFDWLDDPIVGGDEVVTGPTEDDTKEQEKLKEAIREADAEAQKRLDKDKCADLFGGKEKAKAALQKANIYFGNLGEPTYDAKTNKVKSINAVTKDGAIYINTKGAFFNNSFAAFDKDNNAQHFDLSFGTGYSGKKLAAVILLHELGHLVGKFEADSQDYEKNLAYTKQVLEACFL
jgi:RHS repeat-associated protein